MAAENADQWGISVSAWARISLVVNGFSLAVFGLIASLIWWRVRSGFGLLTAYVLLLGGSAAMGTAIYGSGLP
jgi:phosphotransferase system  glucose/maltose/N-acetylglucosamine-specific IIC component